MAVGIGRKFLRWTVAAVVLVLAVFIYFKFFFVFGEGVKTGHLNFFVYKGYVFKTYEGRIIQTGYRSEEGGVQSNEFDFSVDDKEVATQLERKGGEVLDLYYKQYLGRLPWRGMQKYVVYKFEEKIVLAPKNEDIPAEIFPSEAL